MILIKNQQTKKKKKNTGKYPACKELIDVLLNHLKFIYLLNSASYKPRRT